MMFFMGIGCGFLLGAIVGGLSSLTFTPND